jgi:hypothetical protein
MNNSIKIISLAQPMIRTTAGRDKLKIMYIQSVTNCLNSCISPF